MRRKSLSVVVSLLLILSILSGGTFGGGIGIASAAPVPPGTPIATPDQYTISNDQTLSISAPGFLANDVDPEGEALTGMAILDSPDNGVLTAFPDGSFDYTPNTGFTGTDSFTYRMRDDSFNTAEATVTIEVLPAANRAPIAKPDEYTVANDQVLSISAPGFLANDIDLDGETLTGMAVLDSPDNGVLTAFPDGSFDYTPDSGFVGTDSFTYRMRDASFNTAEATVTIEVLPAANRAPITKPDEYAVVSGQILSISASGFLANDIDLDGEALTGMAVLDSPDNGVLTAFPDGSFDYTPNAGFTGTDSFTYRMRDASFNTAEATVTIEVLSPGTTPVATPDEYTVANDQVLSISAPGFLANDIDLDGETLTGMAVLDSPDNGVLTAFPDGSFDYTPNAGFTGTDSFTYRMRDASFNTAEATVTIEVVAVNTPPVVIEATVDPIDEGEAATLSVSFTDPDVDDTNGAVVDWGDGTSTSLSAVTSPFEATHVYGDDGAYTVTVTVTDAVGAEDRESVVLTVENLAPSVAIDGGDFVVGTVGGETSLGATATDPGSDDLGFAWSTGDSSTYFNDGVGPDPALSPGGTFPFAASDTTTVPFDSIGVGTVDLTVTDDDGGSATDDITILTVGDADAARSQGFWAHQYSGKGKAQYDETTLESFLAITGVTSDVFSETAPATTVQEADDILGPSPGPEGPKVGDGGNDAAEMREKATAQLLAAWLNFAAGGVAWDEPIDTGVDGVGVAPFHEVVTEAEGILLDTDATHADLERAKDIAEAINRHDEAK